jgi:glycosyltransferase involved in cell wall biosynthesis
VLQRIPYGLDVDVFCPRDRQSARRALALPDDAMVLAFGAESLDSHRKGIRYLLEALSLLNARDRVVGLAFGSGPIPAGGAPLPRIRKVGYIGDSILQASIYSAADIFVLPSLEDNLPLTGLEAMACGTPVVAFDAGGVPDYVRPGETGLLARAGDAADLARRIDQLLERPHEIRRLGVAARAAAEREFSVEWQAKRYLELYRQALRRPRRGERAAA